MSDIEEQLKGQYLGTLLTFMKEASDIANSRDGSGVQRYWKAIEFYEKQIIPFIVKWTEEDEKVFNVILEEIKRIRKSSFKIKGEISHVTDWYRYVYLNTQGSTLYGKIVNSVTKQLTNQNFYSFLKKEYGPDISKIDMKKAEEY